jgi:hypothetical protein
LFLVFDLILVSFPKKVPLRTENLRKKGIRRRGGHALKRERHLASRGTRAGGQQNVVGGAKKKKNKNRRAIWRGRWMAAGANESTEQKIQSGLYLSRVSLYAFHPKE